MPGNEVGRTWLDAINWAVRQFPQSDVRHHELMSFVFWKLSQRYASNAEILRHVESKVTK